MLGDQRLKLTALMENLLPAVADRQHKVALDRLRRVLELGHDLAPDQPPLVQTVLGSGKWDEKKKLFHDGGYRGDVCCEVSSMVSGKPGHDPLTAAKTCYRNLARALHQPQRVILGCRKNGLDEAHLSIHQNLALSGSEHGTIPLLTVHGFFRIAVIALAPPRVSVRRKSRPPER